jgi:hypothetical protein
MLLANGRLDRSLKVIDYLDWSLRDKSRSFGESCGFQSAGKAILFSAKRLRHRKRFMPRPSGCGAEPQEHEQRGAYRRRAQF